MYECRIRLVLQDNAMVFLVSSRSAEESSPSSILEHLADTFAGFSGAFQIVLRTDLLGNCHTLLDVITQSAQCCQCEKR